MARKFGWEDIGIGLLSMKAPSIARGYYGAKEAQESERAQQQQNAALSNMAGQLYGQQGRDFNQTDMDMGGGAQRSVIQEPQQAAGLLGQDMDPARRVDIEQRQAMLKSGNPVMQKMALDMMADRQSQNFGARNRAAEPPKPFKPSMFTTGVEGRPGMRQQSYFGPEGNLQTAGPAWKTGAQTVVNVGSGSDKPKAEPGLMVTKDPVTGGWRQVPIPGGKFDRKGAQNVLKETEGYNKANSSINNTISAIDDYDNLVGEVGVPWNSYGYDAKQLQQAQTGVLMELKNSLELGVLSGPDEALINKIMPKADGPINWALFDTPEVQSLIRKAKRVMVNKRKNLRKQYPNAEIPEQVISEAPPNETDKQRYDRLIKARRAGK